MNTLVVYYSYTGGTKVLAVDFAEKESAETLEILDIKKTGKVKAYTAGCFASIKGKSWEIQPISTDLSGYDRFVLFAPIWAGNVPPAVNAFLSVLPSGKNVAVKAVSGSGKSGCENKIKGILKEKGCELESFENIKS